MSKVFGPIKGNGVEIPFLFLFFITFEQKNRKIADNQQEKQYRLPRKTEIEKQIVPKEDPAITGQATMFAANRYVL